MSGTMLTNPFRFGPAAPYAANGVNFDGTNDYLERGADLTGNADSKLYSGSLWFKRGNTGLNSQVLAGNSRRHEIFFHSGNTFRVAVKQPGSGTTFEVRSATTFTSTAVWYHVMWSIDLTDSGKRHFYVDGVDDSPSWNTYDNNLMEFTEPDHAFGARVGGSTKINACFADPWFAFGQYIDLSVAANRLKFYNAGSPVDLGSDGSTPTGTAAIIFFSGVTAGWETNDGSGGGFTENGALTDCGTDP